ncbi:MAG: HD domain-containing protein [Candidatus Woesearchaeota archaeon]
MLNHADKKRKNKLIKKEIIKKALNFIKKEYENEATGHDYWHTYRVWKLSKFIAKNEKNKKKILKKNIEKNKERNKEKNKEKKLDLFLLEISAILHDLDDWKFSNSNNCYEKTEKFLKNLGLEKTEIKKIIDIINEISFKGSFRKPKKIEAQIVQDADRLDAIGAIGIARTFAYGGYKKRAIYDPNIKPEKIKDFEHYKNKKSTTINHFYEKLLLIKNKLNTKTAKEIAKKRHNFLLKFLKEFYDEWNFKF